MLVDQRQQAELLKHRANAFLNALRIFISEQKIMIETRAEDLKIHVLHHIADRCVAPACGKRLPADRETTAPLPQQTADDFRERTLATAVMPKKCDTVTHSHRERDIAQDILSAHIAKRNMFE